LTISLHSAQILPGLGGAPSLCTSYVYSLPARGSVALQKLQRISSIAAERSLKTMACECSRATSRCIRLLMGARTRARGGSEQAL